MFQKKKKPIERICKNCRLFNPQTSECSVVILVEGERTKIPVDPQDSCFFEANPELGQTEDFTDMIQQVRFWCEDEDGKKTDGNGKVKVEYPKGFFGKTIEQLFGD